MQRLVAIRMQDDGDGCLVLGYAARQKNRRVTWAFRAETRDPKVIRAMVEDAEENRLRVEGPKPGLPYLKGGSDDDNAG